VLPNLVRPEFRHYVGGVKISRKALLNLSLSKYVTIYDNVKHFRMILTS
jgi:hypothetical protein